MPEFSKAANTTHLLPMATCVRMDFLEPQVHGIFDVPCWDAEESSLVRKSGWYEWLDVNTVPTHHSSQELLHCPYLRRFDRKSIVSRLNLGWHRSGTISVLVKGEGRRQ